MASQAISPGQLRVNNEASLAKSIRASGCQPDKRGCTYALKNWLYC